MKRVALLKELAEWGPARARWEGALLEAQQAIARIDERRRELEAILFVEHDVEHCSKSVERL